MPTRVALPELAHATSVSDPIIELTRTNSSGDLQLVRKLFLYGSTNTVACRVTDTDQKDDSIRRFFHRLQDLLPVIGRVRLHICVDLRVTAFDCEQFLEIVRWPRWPKLTQVILEVSKDCPGMRSCATDEQVSANINQTPRGTGWWTASTGIHRRSGISCEGERTGLRYGHALAAKGLLTPALHFRCKS